MHYGVAVGKAEPLNKVKALPEVVEGSSEDEEEEEEVDHELVEKKVQTLLGTIPSWFPTALARSPARGDWGHLWMFPGTEASLVAPGSWGHHQALMGTGVIAACLWGLGTLLYTHTGLGHCQMSARTRGIVRCLRDLGVSPDTSVTSSISRCLVFAGTGMFSDAHRDRGHPLGAHGV